ncbi:MAG: efflux RND transporter periplasmic adaptor subunit, partial [Desulfosalsimonadaceae bacterium]|nr:efflux RND transporter periplasmic adaptor subunit [Desulfosalsimonadaceae bacterium]
MNKKFFFILTTVACAAIVAVVFNFRTAQSNNSAKDAGACASTCAGENTKACATEKPDAHGTEIDGHDAHPDGDHHEEGEAASDLDRPVDELWAAQCEHDILHYTCDECRYELGVVKVSDTVIGGEGKPGIVAVAKAAAMNFSKPLLLTGEVRLNETKTVRVSTPLEGTVKNIPADIGGRFTAGDALLTLDSNEVSEAKAEYMKNAAAASLAKKTAEREAGLIAIKISAEVEVQEPRNSLSEAEIELR